MKMPHVRDCAISVLLRVVCFLRHNECTSSPCENGNCQDMVNQYRCACNPGWTGVNCEQGIKHINELIIAFYIIMNFL